MTQLEQTSIDMDGHAGADTGPGMHLPALGSALLIMVVGSLYPPSLLDASGQVQHGMVSAVFWAMSAGFVRGLGFVPHRPIWRWLFSGWACVAALALAAWLRG